jgi:hypothetical protein
MIMTRENFIKTISANLYSKVKASIAQAFAPAFASALA